MFTYVTFNVIAYILLLTMYTNVLYRIREGVGVGVGRAIWDLFYRYGIGMFVFSPVHHKLRHGSNLVRRY